MRYVALTWYLLLIVLTGMGLYRLWAARLGGAVVDWLMLPATLVSELSYSLGRLITGRPAYGGIIAPQNASSDPCRHAISGRFGLLVSMLASLMTLLACGACLGLMAAYLDVGIISDMVTAQMLTCLDLTSLPDHLPTGWGEFWEQMQYQVVIIQRITTAWMRQDWLTWQVPVFVYAAAVFSVRLGAVRHDARATLLVALGLAGLTTALAAMIPAVHDLLAGDLWYLLTYIWGNLLFLLAVTLAVMGLMALCRLLIPGAFRSAGSES